MAKTKHNNLLDTIDEIWTDAKNKGAAVLTHEDEIHTGRTLKLLGKELLHFGTCEYMGLGLDERLKNAAIDQIKKCGVQFAVSRAFVSSRINS